MIPAVLQHAVTNEPWVFCLVAAFLLGAAIGLERQLHQRMAGLRTNILVSTGAAMFCITPYFFPTPGEVLRIPAQVVTGIGFLGAGVIMREGLTVKGIDTAATLWCSAAVGALCGMGLWKQATVGTVLILVANGILRPIMQRIHRIQDQH